MITRPLVKRREDIVKDYDDRVADDLWLSSMFRSRLHRIRGMSTGGGA